MHSSRVDRPASPFVFNKTFEFEESSKYIFVLSFFLFILIFITFNLDQLSSKDILNDLNEKELILRIINESNFNKQLRCFPHYLVKRAQIVKNITLDNEYMLFYIFKILKNKQQCRRIYHQNEFYDKFGGEIRSKSYIFNRIISRLE